MPTMDTVTNRRERSNYSKSKESDYTVDTPKKGQQEKPKNDRFRALQRYRFRRGRKVIFGFVAILLLYLYLFKALIGNIEIPSQEGLPPNQEGWPPREQTKTNERFEVTKLRAIDREQYTIRMNTWRRPKQLIQSVKHHASCPGVKEIQIVWCDKENEPPPELLEMAKTNGSIPSDTRVVIERHEANSLNERFNILEPTPTLGILSIDDDVLRPCEAIDSGFFKWVKSPHRMVGFDARTHVVNDDGSWQYGYLSTTKTSNKYSLALTRYCFIHRDYMIRYIRDLPATILDTVATKFNCEDIAMSLMISSLTKGRPPLLADLWAMNSQLKMEVDSGISSTGTHKKFRDNCLDSFAELFELKDESSDKTLQQRKWIHNNKDWMFDCGDSQDDKAINTYAKSQREIELEQTLEALRGAEDKKLLQKYLAVLAYKAGEDARANGLIKLKK